MNIKAVALVTDINLNPGDNTKIDVACTIVVLGNDIGDLVEGRYGATFADINPAQAAADIEAAVLDDLESHGIAVSARDRVKVDF